MTKYKDRRVGKNWCFLHRKEGINFPYVKAESET